MENKFIILNEEKYIFKRNNKLIYKKQVKAKIIINIKHKTRN